MRKAHTEKCKECESVFRCRPSDKRRFCSMLCRCINDKKHGTHSGLSNGRWNGGKVTGKYILLLKPNHPNANKTGYVMEHRYVMSEFLKRPIEKNEDVHHINGDKHDNRIENLVVLKKEEHSVITVRERNRRIKSGIKGAYRTKYGRYTSRIIINKKFNYLGTFLTKEEAGEAYQKALARFQKAHDISPAAGVLGPKTRKFIG